MKKIVTEILIILLILNLLGILTSFYHPKSNLILINKDDIDKFEHLFN